MDSIKGPCFRKGALCEAVLRSLPDWFGIEEAVRQYALDIDRLPTFLVMDGDRALGFLSLKIHNEYSAELYVMGIRPEAQRQGIGRGLLGKAEAFLREQGIEYLQVKTLGSSHPDEHYAKTRAFYLAMGFRPIEEFFQTWNAENPCLVMVKKISEQGIIP